MQTYKKEELMSSTDIVRNFSSVLESIKNKKRDKIAVLRKNKLEAVILPIEEYERIQELADIMEHLQLSRLIKEREKTPIDEYVDFEQILSEHGLGRDEL
ncbi:type II toxin-antitoxin system Phd/YefM family antitoxin [Desulfonatronospira sp.]|uniref:type II toxin-antitoxin system Phd/YefM family antitoxin n=1 Tax=Desulfonatronospira sp. TaxID=1962951 RepID=UPI0025C6D8A3|nr:type II toxin-antitoxin system Phd/YefM family antitoxin [Desulfonatronospira sp.]